MFGSIILVMSAAPGCERPEQRYPTVVVIAIVTVQLGESRRIGCDPGTFARLLMERSESAVVIVGTKTTVESGIHDEMIRVDEWTVVHYLFHLRGRERE